MMLLLIRFAVEWVASTRFYYPTIQWEVDLLIMSLEYYLHILKGYASKKLEILKASLVNIDKS